MPFLDFRMPSGYSHTGRRKMTRRWKGGSHSWLDQRPLRSTRAAPPQIPLALRSKVWLNGQKGYYLTKQLATTKISKIARECVRALSSQKGYFRLQSCKNCRLCKALSQLRSWLCRPTEKHRSQAPVSNQQGAACESFHKLGQHAKDQQTWANNQSPMMNGLTLCIDLLINQAQRFVQCSFPIHEINAMRCWCHSGNIQACLGTERRQPRHHIIVSLTSFEQQ